MALIYTKLDMLVTFTTIINSPCGRNLSHTSSYFVKEPLLISFVLFQHLSNLVISPPQATLKSFLLLSPGYIHISLFVLSNFIQIDPLLFHAPHRRTRHGGRNVILSGQHQQNTVPAIHRCLRLSHILCTQLQCQELHLFCLFALSRHVR